MSPPILRGVWFATISWAALSGCSGDACGGDAELLPQTKQNARAGGEPTPRPSLEPPPTAVGFDGALFQSAARKQRGSVDLDRDGRPERWRYRWHGGSGFGGWWLKIDSPGRRQALTMESEGSFGVFLSADVLSSGWGASPSLLDGTLAWAFGPKSRRDLAYSRSRQLADVDSPWPAADGSFEWLVDYRLWPALPRREPFLSRRAYRPRWQSGAPRNPVSQLAILDGTIGRRLARRVRRASGPLSQGAGEQDAASPTRSLLLYAAHNHGIMRRGARCGDWSLYTTKHGVAVHRRTARRWSWAYVSTDVTKLRWRSLERAACDDVHGVVVLERSHRPRRELWVVLPEKGVLGRLPLPSGASWSLQPGSHRLVVGRQSYELSALARTLASPDDRPDLDGDGKPDPIEVKFTGGGHCCYRYTIRSSRTGHRVALPFFQDGGVTGLDPAARPHRYLVADFDGDGVVDLQARVNTYNGQPQKPSAALRRFGVLTNNVVVRLAKGKLTIGDLQ